MGQIKGYLRGRAVWQALAGSVILQFLVVACLALFSAPSFAADPPPPPPTTAVLVHGAFADGSAWNKVVPLLQKQGLKVIVVQNPLSSLADDVAFTKRAIKEAPGPVVLVGHSWGGAVITQAGVDPKVKALVYVAAFAPSVGQSSADTVKDHPAPPGLARLIVSDGYLKLSPEGVATDFAQDASDSEKKLIEASQGAVRAANFDEKLTAAAWVSKPSWYIVTEQDRMIHPEAQRAAAAKIKANVKVLRSSHVPMLSRPLDVAKVIAGAAKSTSP